MQIKIQRKQIVGNGFTEHGHLAHPRKKWLPQKIKKNFSNRTFSHTHVKKYTYLRKSQFTKYKFSYTSLKKITHFTCAKTLKRFISNVFSIRLCYFYFKRLITVLINNITLYL